MDKILTAVVLVLGPHLAGVSGQQQVRQSPQSLTVWEGKTAVMDCNYENSLFNYFPWYRQSPGESPALLIAIQSVSNKKEDGRFTIFFNKSEKQLSLHIADSQPGDSATYFCAASAQCSPGTCSPYTNPQLRLSKALLWAEPDRDAREVSFAGTVDVKIRLIQAGDTQLAFLQSPFVPQKQL